MTDGSPENEEKPFQELAPLGDAPVAPAHVVASVALNLALKYHDINTIQDGTLYQQYKLEGRNMETLHLDMVFETAIRMEAHLLGSSQRIADLICSALEAKLEDEPEAEAPTAPTEESKP